MYCPKCGTQNVEGASYCRSCGANVSLVPQALTGQLPVADQAQYPDRKSRKGQRREPSIEEAVRTMTMGIAFAVVSVLVGRYAPAGQTWWFWLLIPAFAMFAKGLGELARLRMSQNRSAGAVQPQLNAVRQQDLPAPNTGDLRVPAPSVTEGTTRHLGSEARTRQLDSFEDQRPS
ncbi:MAG TPA: zinc-ribbon domain-containing protein [Pyrinomonadaceae bacterium]|nr:zinc-ribbon domain-containing protein [Pyrinomonadaceae bacterium]